MGYHVWKYTSKRRRGLIMVTSKRLSRWDTGEVPAFWEKRSAANSWLRSETRKEGATPDGGMVLKCECRPGVGMGDHG